MLLILVPIAAKLTPYDLTSLFILTLIFLGFGFSDKSNLVLFLLCTVVVITRLLIDSESQIVAILSRLFSYSFVVFISANVTRHYLKVIRHRKELNVALAKALDSRDKYTANHSENVANYALKIAQEMNLHTVQCESIYTGGLLHDIGKIGVPEYILTKPDKLTADEFESIKLHPVIGHDMLKHISDFHTNGVLDIILYHHERYDGLGYPKGLKGNEIPLLARIISIADSIDAMASRRVYREKMKLDDIISEINKNKGTQYDPEIADVFLRLLRRNEIQIK